MSPITNSSRSKQANMHTNTVEDKKFLKNKIKKDKEEKLPLWHNYVYLKFSQKEMENRSNIVYIW